MIYFYDDWFAYFEVDETTNTALRQIEIKSSG